MLGMLTALQEIYLEDNGRLEVSPHPPLLTLPSPWGCNLDGRAWLRMPVWSSTCIFLRLGISVSIGCALWSLRGWALSFLEGREDNAGGRRWWSGEKNGTERRRVLHGASGLALPEYEH